MKKLSFLFLSAILFIGAGRVAAQSCCKKPAGKDMKALAMNKSFKAAHEAPLPLNYTAQKGAMVSFPVAGGADGKAFYVPGDETTDRVLLVFHEWWGLNEYIKREAENWQKELGGHVAVYAVDLYDGKVATAADEAGKLAQGLDDKRGEAIISGLLKKIGSGKKIASIGWCMGGSWSFTGARLAGRDASGCVMYYGFPDQDSTHLAAIKTNILYIYGTKDNYIKVEDVRAFGNKLIKKGKGFTFQSYEAVHAFANPSNPKYDEKAATSAHSLAVAFLKGELGIQ